MSTMICTVCNKKLTLVNTFECKCKKMLCTKHRHADLHNCTFNHLEFSKKLLEMKNPKIISNKLEKV